MIQGLPRVRRTIGRSALSRVTFRLSVCATSLARSSLEFTPLHSSLGAIVEGVDCNNDFADQANVLKSALARWQVLLFRGQDLSDGAFLAFCRNFGELELLPEPESATLNIPRYSI